MVRRGVYCQNQNPRRGNVGTIEDAVVLVCRRGKDSRELLVTRVKILRNWEGAESHHTEAVVPRKNGGRSIETRRENLGREVEILGSWTYR